MKINIRFGLAAWTSFSVLLAGGCTTSPSNLRSKAGPTLNVESTKSAREVASCIVEIGGALYPMGSMNMRPSKSGFTVIQQDRVWLGKDIPFFAEVDERGSGSTTTYYNNALAGMTQMDQVVITCQR